MLVCDIATAVSRERTPEGFLHVRARIGRAGIQLYRADEIGAPPGLAPPGGMLRVYRAPDDVFAPDSLASFGAKPVTLDHPPRMVDSANWKQYAVGHSGPGVGREDDHVAADLTITDAAAVERAQAGAELSNGYWADFVFEPGRTPEGEPYDAVQRNIRGNHIALVDAGRCGPTCRIDAASPVPAQDGCGCGAPVPAHPVALDGTTMAGDAEVIVHLRQTVEAREGEIAALKAAAPSAAALDALVAERADLIGAAQTLIGPGFDGRGQTNTAIRRLAVGKLLGVERIRERGDDYVSAAFDTLLAARRPGNALSAHLSAGPYEAPSERDAALEARNLYLTQAWKGHSAGDA